MREGERIGRFEILGELGSGGMGVLLRARDPKLGRVVALKLLTDRLSTSSEHRLRFEQEAHAASVLGHPNIVTIYEIGDHGDQPYIAMELVEGRSLREVLNEGFPSLKSLVSLAMQMAHGLAAAHEKGITHRDLKPENVMVTRHGLVKILDFGLAKIAQPAIEVDDPTADFEIVTQPGRVLGTVGYMSPEQARGLRVDYRSDQFTFGTILYEMLTGRRPFRGTTPLDTLSAILHQEPEPIGELAPRTPPPLVWLVNRCLAKDPEARYASTLDIARELESILARTSETGTFTGTMPTPAEAPRRWPRWAAAGGAVVALLLLAGLPRLLRHDAGSNLLASAQNPTRVAVLPFRDLTGEPSGTLVGEGFAETVSVRLSAIEGLAVLPSNGLSEATSDPLQAVRAAGAQLVLRGSLQFEGTRVRATYALLAEAGRQIAAGSAEGATTRLLDLQDEVARQVAEALGVSAGVEEPRSRIAAQDRYLEALGHLRRYENPASVDAAIAILDELDDTGEVAGALARAYLAKYSLTEDRRWVERAIAQSRHAVELDPASVSAHETLGQVEVEVGEATVAETEFRQVLERQPNSVEARIGLARALAKQGKDAEAERTFRDAIATQPGWWAPHNGLGVFLLFQGRLPESIESFQRAIRTAPDNTRAITNLGTAYQQLGRYDDAVREYERSIEIRPTPVALSNLGALQFALRRFADAAETFRRATALQPTNATVWLNLGDALRWAGDASAAREAYGRAISLAEDDLAVTPLDAERHSTLALALAWSGEIEAAREHLARALEIDATNSYFMYQAGLVELAAGDTAAALDRIEAAVRAGYPVESLVEDPQVDGLRNDPRFARISANSPVR